MALTYDDSTIASIPGRIKIDKSKFLKFYQISGVSNLFYSMILNIKLDRLNKVFPRNSIIQQWINLNEHFEYGCANPSIIINRSKGIFATYTDLTNDGGDSTPVIKIVQLNKSDFDQLNLKDNEKIVTVSMYYRNHDMVNSRIWSDFKPLIPHLFSNNSSAIIALQEKLSDQAWECLKIGLNQIDKIEKQGLYHIILAEELTKNAY